MRGWITDSAATALLKGAGLDMAQLRKDAESREFKPVSTGITIDFSAHNSVKHLSSANVVGVVRGHDSKLKNEYVAISAHWDHLGIGVPVNGDSIYNGSVDNGSGVASTLAIARAAAKMPTTRRSLIFLFVTAEESGLLGSQYYGEHPTVPAASIVADLNLNVVTVNGRVRDLDVMGDNKSTLGPMLASLVRPQGMKLSPDAHPEAGHFYRSDHFSLREGRNSVGVDRRGRRLYRQAEGLRREGERGLQRAPLPSARGRVQPRLRSQRRRADLEHRAEVRAHAREFADHAHLERRRGVQGGAREIAEAGHVVGA